MNILNNKPMFEVRWKASNLMYFMDVNGIAIQREFSPTGEIKTATPVNHLFRSGTNTLQITVIPNGRGASFEAGQSIVAELWVYQDGKEDVAYKLGDINFYGGGDENDMLSRSIPSGKLLSSREFARDEEGDVEIFDIEKNAVATFDGAFLLKRNFYVDNALPLWAFFNSGSLPDPDQLSKSEYQKAKEELFPEYERIQKALDDGSAQSIDSIMPMFDERNREIDMAFYKESGETEKELRESMLANASDSGKKIVEVYVNKLMLIRESNEKVIGLNRARCKAAIGFNYTEFTGSTSYDISFRRENGKWIICR